VYQAKAAGSDVFPALFELPRDADQAFMARPEKLIQLGEVRRQILGGAREQVLIESTSALILGRDGAGED
jgi:hypothetical protein